MIAEKVQELEHENRVLKKQVERLRDICGDRVELPKNCEYCSNFIQHYVRNGNSYIPTYDGHCVAGNRIKGRKLNDTCKFFMKKQYGKNFV